MANGLQSDTRAGGVRIPANLVQGAADLSPNVEALSNAFRKGQITANDIIDRFGQRAIEEDRAKTAQAVVAQKEATELAPLALEAKKAQLDPTLVSLQVQAQKGGLEAQIAEQAFEETVRVPKQKLQQAILAQAIDELDSGLNAAAVRQLAFDYPNLVKPQYDQNGVVQNAQEVRNQIAQVKNQQQFTETMRKLAQNTEVRKLERADGTTEDRVVYKGTNIPVSAAQQQAIFAAQTGTPGGVIQNPQVVDYFQKSFGAPGQVSPAAPQAQAPAAAAAPATGAAPAGQTPSGFQSQVGQMTPEGGLITGQSNRQKQVLSDIQQFVQKSKPVETYGIMAPYAAQASTLEEKLIPGTGQYAKEFERNGKAFDHSLIFNYMKLVDPTSVVREGEFKYATGLSPIDDYLINTNNIKNQWLNRQIMTDSTRSAILGRIKELTYATAESAALSLASFANQAEREGLSPDQAVGAANADLLRYFGKLPGKAENIPPFLEKAKAHVGGARVSTPISKTDASGLPDPSQIIRIDPDDVEAISRARRTGGWFWIKGEQSPRRWR